jgi:hypothetical protein
MLNLLAQGTGEIIGIAAVAGLAIGGAFKLASTIAAKRQNGNAAIPVRLTDLPCGPHGERLASIEAHQQSMKERLDSIAQDVKEILERMQNKGP